MRRTPYTEASWLALLTLCIALIATTLVIPRPWSLAVGTPGDAYFITNSFPPEAAPPTPLRWTRATTTLSLYGAYAGPTTLELRLFREAPPTPDQAWPVTLATDTHTLATFNATPGWRRYQLALPPGATLAPLTLSSPTFQPSRADPRHLGVALSELRVLPLSGAPPLAFAFERALWCGALLLLLGTAAPNARQLTALLGAALVTWAWCGPRSFAWGLPTHWPTAIVAAIAVAVGLWLAQQPQQAHHGTMTRRFSVGGGALALTSHLALALPVPSSWVQLAALVILLAPGALLALALFNAETDAAERAFLASAGAVSVLPLLLLALHALPGPLPSWLALVTADALSLGAAWALWLQRKTAPAPAAPPRPQHWLLLPLGLALATRLWGLGIAEFQGDEAYALMLAKGVIHGQADILLVHMKGPVEALLPTGVLAITGTTSELVARLPFALAGVGLVLGVWALAGRLIGGRRGDVMGFIAALGVAADGLLIAFGRMVQYQTVVLLLAAAALWLVWRFYTGSAPRRYLTAAAGCAAVALLAHYDGMYVLPALAWLVVAGGIRRGWPFRQWLTNLTLPVLVGLTLTLSFYVPFVLHEHFARTLGHLATRSGQGGATEVLYNNLAGYAVMLSVYTTPYAAAAMGLALLGTLAALLAISLRPRLLGWALAALLTAGGLLATLAPTLLARGPDTSLAGLLCLPPLVVLALAPRLPMNLRALVLWLVGPLAAHAFLIADPRTHFYTLHAAGWLLVAWGAAALVTVWPRLHPVLAAVGTALLTLSLTYTSLVFLHPWPEFERAYPATQLPFFTPPGGKLPDDGIFAFPHQDGWKTVAALFQQGVLRGAMDTNQELFTPGWYLRGQFKCVRQPDYFLTANGAQPLFIPPGYTLFGTVSVDGVRTLEIYSREPVVGPPQTFAAADYAAAFDAAPVPNFPLRRLLSGVVPQTALETPWRDGFALRGFDQDRTVLGPADPLFLTLYWRAEQALPAPLTPAVLVRDAAGRTIAEAAPYCSGMPAEAWFRTYVNDTPFRLAPGTLPPGRYTLHAGVRDQTTGAWLPLADGTELLSLGALTVRE